MNSSVYLTKKKYFHRLESDSARNNIYPNNKQKPEITNKTREKLHFNMASQPEYKCRSRQIWTAHAQSN